MSRIQITINRKKYFTRENKTILEAALENNIFIPHLCYDPRLRPQAACRLCLVEVSGMPEAVPSCITRVRDGMNITTNSRHINELVKLNLELIVSDHPLDCMTCDSTGNCALQDLAYTYDIEVRGFKGKVHQKKVLHENPFIIRDNEKCILCGRCVRMCDEIVGANAIGYAGRGFESEIIPAFEQSLINTNCVFCGNCISTCPVGALQARPYIRKARAWQTKKVTTTCPYCGVGCQIDLYAKDNKIVDVSSEIGKNVNQGNLCVKGKFGLSFATSPVRLTHPLVKDKNGKFRKTTWEKAIKLTAQKFGSLIKEYGPDSIGVLSSAKVTNEENYLMSKFTRAVLGTNNIDHCARLCHASTITGLIPTFGSGAMTNSIGDIKYSDASIIIGSNTTEAHPVISYEIIRNVIANKLKLVIIDPRDIPITKYATVHLKQKPGTDIAVIMGLINIIYNSGLHDKEYIKERTIEFDNLVKELPKYSPEKVAKISGVNKDDLIKAAHIYGSAQSASIFYSMGITQHTCGTENVISVANLAMLTGNIGKKGGGVNPLRGQNNVQGACDMGALPNMFSGYQYVEDVGSRKKFEEAWGRSLPDKNGLTLTEMIDAAISKKLKALYIMGENPMLSDPDILHVAGGLKNLDFLVVQDIFLTESAEFADVVFPGTCFAEKEGTFTNTERRIQRVRKALDPPGDSKADSEIISLLSDSMGYRMTYGSPSEVMDEIARLTPIYAGVSYRRLEIAPLQWPCTDCSHQGTDILHAKNFSRGKGRFMPVEFTAPAEEPDEEFPFILTTGRILYHFHTRTMTGKVEGLNTLAPFAIAHINSEDAKKFGLNDGDSVILRTRRGSITAAAKVDDKIKSGVVFLPFHYADAPANKLTNPKFDPHAKIPEFKACAVKITRA